MTNAKFYRNLICAGLGALAFSHVPLSHAAYAQLTPPVGWSYGGSAAATYSATKSAAQVTSEALARIAANASISTGGKTIPIPVKFPLAEGAAKVAASAIFLHPGLRTAAQVATWLGVAGLVYDAASGLWGKPDSSAVSSDGYVWRIRGSGVEGAGPDQLCNLQQFWPSGTLRAEAIPQPEGFTTCRLFNAYGVPNDAFSVERARPSNCPAGWYVTPAGCVQSQPLKPVTQPEFEQMVPDARPMPPELPGIVWPAVWPVKAPEIQPMFIPTGNPVPNPNYDPAKAPSPTNQPYNQPGVRVVPAPTADNPWQVDLQPVNRPVDSPVAKPDPAPEVNPDGTPKPDQGDKPKEDKEAQDLCEKHPDILACQKIDTEVDNAEIPKSQKTVSYQAENIWGGGSCPADKFARVGGQEIKVVDWSRDCQFVTDYVKPVALALSALIVAYILAGALKS